MTDRLTLTLDLSELPREFETTPSEAVTALVEFAVGVGASDLFFLSEEDAVAIAVRHMGIVRQLRTYGSEFGTRMLTNVKVLAGMDISDRMKPSEGRWISEAETRGPVDVRVNTIPTMFGEDITCRILNRDMGLRSLSELGLLSHDYHALTSLLKNPSGLILVSGPTGSGKTTTMYSCLQALNDGRRKINTLEDPVEYVLPGLRQSQVNLKQHVDFSTLLSASLRQAPDVIMIGEIRDSETAETSVRAAISGHLVLATLHAQSASTTVESMYAQGVKLQFLASSLLGVVSQRLVRQLCRNCRQPIDLSGMSSMFDDVRKYLSDDDGRVMYSPGQCLDCLYTGYASRMCVSEVLSVDQHIQSLISSGASALEIEQAARKNGMIDFSRSALIRVAMGETTTDEMFRVVPMERVE
ncbi:MAG: GspE/PulE family protein [Planctomycetota bacterium]|nr:GspE/PulE family protein [Planctomycetota bacterium]MDA0920468.1 GspE/PulE family protein [Planctomycetota bacterium]